MNVATPTDWKSEKWWQNRPVEERLHHLRAPKRVLSAPEFPLPPQLQQWVDNFAVGNNLLIHGRSGSRKTTAAVGIAQAVIRSHKVSARYVDADDYVEMTKESFNHDGLLPEMYSTPHLLKYLKNTFDLVIVDNLGQERLTEFSSHTVAGLIKKRHDQMRSTILVSPYNVVDINRRYDNFTASALADYDIVVL